MFVNSDFSDLLRIFKNNGVKYLVVGGYAVTQYAEPRYTKDLDLWISTSPENAAVVFKSLLEFGAPLAGLSEADFSAEGYYYQMGVSPSRIDLLMGVSGIQFDKAWQRRVEYLFDDLPVFFISRDDLIATKRAAGRPQDLIDAEALSQIDRERD
jgi:hypothetical protein